MHAKRPTRRLLGKRTLAGLASIALAAGMMLVGPTGAQAQPGLGQSGSSPADKIAPALQQSLAAEGSTDFWVRFTDQADLSGPSQLEDWVARGTAVAAELRATAQASQAEVVNLLEDPAQRQVRYQAFWVTNAIYVFDGPAGLADLLAGYSEVEGLYEPAGYQLDEPRPGQPRNRINSVEWGIANINADDVWDQFGVRGDGITVANIDTGVQFDHPALVAQYRGNLGGGSFDHNYNWFDAAGNCADAPCDLNGHGSHTMGTMSGDDGGDNQIGVAPEVNWIASNGCCPNEAALIASGQWMLEPTDLNDENPDAGMRPHIVNNSWGTELPSNDPFMEDVLAAWAASGIFGVWSNGNNGPGCSTSGSPGSRIINYSVGAYDIDNDIAGFSSRGPGQDGEIKPNISAPGVDVRSSGPNDTYFVEDGTSMAAPHVAGSIALLWSAAPTLVGKIEATRELLNDTAIDTEDLQCGGTADDNNVFGEGRLDALALLQAAPVGDTGTLTGTVTDAGTGDPIEGASVHVTGEGVDRTVPTGPDGSYSTELPAGDYLAEASAFGYLSQSAPVSVAVGETTTQDFALVAQPLVTVSGLVRDGSGHGWPMYAKVNVDGSPDASVYTNPFTGRYRLRLPANAPYTLIVESQFPGYPDVTETVEVGGGNVVHDVQMMVDNLACPTAPGYEFGSNGMFETFDAGELPDGWTIVDNVGNGQVWQFDDPGGRGNLTGGDGNFAIVDSDEFGSGNSQDTQLVTPVVDLSGVPSPVIRFNQDFNWWVGGQDEFTNVDLSIDGGATWENVFHQSGGDVPGPRVDTVPIPQAGGEPDVQVRFHYGNASFEFWWQVDNVLVGELFCEPVDGGLVAGFVRDRNTGEGINGATVTSVDNPPESTTTFATPDDPARDDGFYWMFSSLTGQHRFTASASNYEDLTRRADVEADWTTRRNFRLAAGQLSIEPAVVEAEVPLGGSAQRTFTVTNTGTAPAQLELSERDGGFEILRADGTTIGGPEILASPGAPERRIAIDAPLSQLAGDASTLGRVGAPAATGAVPHEDPWMDLPNLPQTAFDNNVAVVDGTVYSISGIVGGGASPAVFAFDPVEGSWTQLADMPGTPRAQAAEGVVDGKIYVTGGWSDLDTTTLIYDPATDSWDAGAAAPSGRAAAGTTVLNGQLYVVGGCTTGDCEPHADDVFRYDPGSDSWETLAAYPTPTAWQSCAGLAGAVYCAGGITTAGATTDAFRYDPGSDSWSQVADMPFDLWGGAYVGANGQLLTAGGVTGDSTVLTNQGLTYDPDADTWAELPAANNVLLRSGGGCGLYKVGGADFDPFFGFIPDDAVEVLPGFDTCATAADVPWLTVDPTTASLQPGEIVQVTLTMDADVTQPGAYTASLPVQEDTPYSVAPVEVTMNVAPPATWGKLMGTVMGTSCGGDTAPLADATVHLSTWVMELTLFSDAEGGFAHWLDFRHSPFFVIVAKDGYQPQFRQTAVAAGEITVEDWTLQAVCATGTERADQHLR